MSEISAQAVKELREKTGAGMMDCKKALTEAGGNMEAAIDWLRAKGIAKAGKKADRAAAEGLVGVAAKTGKSSAEGALIELNSETDFVARNEHFQKAASAIAALALKTKGDHETLLALPSPDKDGTVKDMITRLIATIGENIHLRRSAYLTVKKGVIASYMHNAAGDGIGRIGVLVALESDGDQAQLEDFGRKIAMHVAATNPIALSPSDVPAERLEREKQVLVEQIKEDPKAKGKPDQVIEKMLTGRLDKFLEEVVLLKQAFVVDPDKKVEAAVAELAKKLGAPVTLKAFVRFGLGEGVEKKSEDFAAEVAAAAAAGKSG